MRIENISVEKQPQTASKTKEKWEKITGKEIQFRIFPIFDLGWVVRVHLVLVVHRLFEFMDFVCARASIF